MPLRIIFGVRKLGFGWGIYRFSDLLFTDPKSLIFAAAGAFAPRKSPT